ncbi:MAG: hypothetical protein ACKVRO_17825 [Micropepsaceae bacterium]
MNAAGARVWGRLLTWLDHDDAPHAYARLKRAPYGHEDTAKLAPFFSNGRLDTARADVAFKQVAHRIRASRILFVPAVLSGIALKASRLRLIEYLTHQVRQLKDDGFDAEIADIDTGATVGANGARLAEILDRHHCPTWIVTHSKGGLDVLDALVAYPNVRRFVDGWVAFQAPFQGSPVADVACTAPKARRIGASALKLLGADPQAICDLTTAERARYLDVNATEIAQLLAEVPVMCVGTAAGKGLLPSWPTLRWMEERGLRNDGLVPVTSTILPGAHYVLLDGLGHGEVATSGLLSRRKFEQIDLLKILFALMLARQTNRVAA